MTLHLPTLLVVFFLILDTPGEMAWAAKKESPATAKKESLPMTSVNQSLEQIQKDLRRIQEIHQTLQREHYEQIREIQKITEQAKAHQKLLKDLEAQRQAVKPLNTVNVEEVLRFEKIRLIQEQARQNRAVLEGIQKRAREQTKVKKSNEEK